MDNSMQYIVNENGRKTYVIVPVNHWKRLNRNYNKIVNKLEVLSGIKSSLEEIKKAKKPGIELQNLNDFLDENND